MNEEEKRAVVAEVLKIASSKKISKQAAEIFNDHVDTVSTEIVERINNGIYESRQEAIDVVEMIPKELIPNLS